MPIERRSLLLIAIMVGAAVLIEASAFFLLYRTAIAEETARLQETARSQARLIEAVARFDAEYSTDYPAGPIEATLSQIVDAHEHYRGFGETGEFTLSKQVDDQIVFLLSHRHGNLEQPKNVALSTPLAEPMKRALAGISGTIIGLDYRGETVLAAHEPVAETGWGIVAKIDLAEIRAPFFRAGLISSAIGLLVIILGAFLFFRVTQPLIDEVKVLSGFLPICAGCKKIRDDQGYWNQIEAYIQAHSDAQFSHGLCPVCTKDYFPELEP